MVAVVLATSGLLKLQDPAPARATLRQIGFRGGRWSARSFGLLEIAVAVGVLVVGGPIANAAIAALSAVFVVVSWRLLNAATAAETCGCFGRFSAPPSRLHVAVNVVSLGVAVLATFQGTPGLPATVREQGSIGWALGGLGMIGGLLALAVMTVLPATLAAADPLGSDRSPVGLFRIAGEVA